MIQFKTFLSTLLLVASFILFIPMGAVADEFKVIPSLALKEEYNDNILFSTDDKKHSWITTATPGLALINRTEKLDLMLSGIVDIARYHDESSFDSEDQYYKGRLGYMFSPRTNIQVEGGWSRDYRPDRDIMTTGIILDNTRRDRAYGGLSGNWQVSERWTAGASYYYENDDYDAPEYSDVEGHQAGLGLYRILSPTTRGRINVGYIRYLYDTSDTYGGWATVGIDYTFHELWTVIVDVGGRFTQSDYQVPAAADQTSDDWGGVGKASINYKGEKTNMALSFSYDLGQASGRSGPVERTAFVFNIRHRLTKDFSAALSTGYYLNKASAAQFGLEEIDEETYRVSPSLRYEFTKDIYLDLLYDYATTDYKLSDTNAERNLVLLRLYMQYPLFE
jgi:hypothetical protein